MSALVVVTCLFGSCIVHTPFDTAKESYARDQVDIVEMQDKLLFLDTVYFDTLNIGWASVNTSKGIFSKNHFQGFSVCSPVKRLESPVSIEDVLGDNDMYVWVSEFELDTYSRCWFYAFHTDTATRKDSTWYKFYKEIYERPHINSPNCGYKEINCQRISKEKYGIFLCSALSLGAGTESRYKFEEYKNCYFKLIAPIP